MISTFSQSGLIMFNNCSFDSVHLSDWSYKAQNPEIRNLRVIFFLVRTHLKTSHSLIFTMDSTLQRKGWNIFSSRFWLVHACLAAATHCHSVAHFKVCFCITDSKSWASGKKTSVSFKLPRGFLVSFFYFFCRQRRMRRALMDLQTEAAAIAGDAARTRPTRSDTRKQELSPTEAFSLPEHRPSEERLVSIRL